MCHIGLKICKGGGKKAQNLWASEKGFKKVHERKKWA